ncbi:GGDEF domain-containing protein [Alkalimonas collagenimarina]|uniref:diguanylate cyclase n=1 Tax=Alkalimonas collagenimarina TaxID=400390 RepID=A0ABT9GUJ2_9GAMM|nr:GGDEF domain-containing protein [Alkalimonas collagenimarina]MDP4534720.1 GGDEF domain-containing protein [Alkalimonas collagenimarina]
MRLFLQGIVLFSCLLFMLLPAAASCLGSGDDEIEALAKDIGRQPYEALQAIEQALSQGLSLTVERRAWLEAARAQARRMVGLKNTELPQAIEEAKSLPTNHPALLHLQIFNLYGADLSPSTREIIDAMDHKLAQRPADQPATLCLKIRLASVMAYYSSLNGESFELAAKAYLHADTAQLAWMRAEAASVLSQVVLRTDSSYARTFREEALDYFESQAMHDMAANELFMDAMSWAVERDPDSLQIAAEQFRRSGVAAHRANNSFAAAYAEAGLCDMLGQLGRVQEALQSCSASLEQLKGVGHITEYITIINFADVLLADNRPEQAMEMLAPLPKDWPDWASGFNGYRFYHVRGKIHVLLGNAEEAIADLTSALRELRGHESSARARNNRLFQSRFRVDLLEQSLELQTLEAKEREQRNRILLVAGLIVLVLLCVIVITLIRHQRLYRRMAFTDLLTGVANRRYTEVRAQEALEHARARRQPLCIALLDLDQFKTCNDRYGHDAGDEALKRFANVAENVLRPGDLFGRWGGEEFLLVLQSTDRSAATAVLERLRSAAAAEHLALAPDYLLQFSAGIVEFRHGTEQLTELLTMADQALYRAKFEGRNRSCFAL